MSGECTIKGETFNNRRIFESQDEPKRTDASFRCKLDIKHHDKNQDSPLLVIEEIDMIYDFPLEFFHLGYLNVTSRMLGEYWMTSNSTKLSRENILRISQRLINLSEQVTCEFQRSTRSLGDVDKWKGVEFRFFTVYTGPFVLIKDILPEELYMHFLLYHVSCRILFHEQLCKQYTSHVRVYLKKFVYLFKKYYGKESLVLSVHSLIHVTDDIEKKQCSLNDISAFPFESALGQLKDELRSIIFFKY